MATNVQAYIPASVGFTPQEISRLLSDPVLFVHNTCFTYDPRPEAFPHHLPFQLYPFQVESIREMYQAITTGQDLFIEKSRDMGASWMVAAVLYYCWLTQPSFQALIGSRNEKSVDNGAPDSLFWKLSYLIDRGLIKPEGYETEKHRNFAKIVNPVNGNMIVGEASSPNFGRKGRYTVVVFDEGAFWPDIQQSWVSANESTRCRIFITTPPQEVNYAKTIRDSSIKKLTLHWTLHPKKDQSWYKMQCERLNDPVAIAQELDIDWQAALSAKVYPSLITSPSRQLSFNKEWPLFVAHDPGHRPDPYAVGIFQKNMETGEIHILDGIEFKDREVKWLYPFFTGYIDSSFAYSEHEMECISRWSGWIRSAVSVQHYGDHAGTAGQGTSGLSVYQMLGKDCNTHVITNTKAVGHTARGSALKSFSKRFVFNTTVGAQYIRKCLVESSYPDTSSGKVVDSGKEYKPLHDWTSHSRSMVEYFCVNFRDPEWEKTFDSFRDRSYTRPISNAL